MKESPYTVLVRDLPTKRTFDVAPAQVGEWLRGLPMRDALDEPARDAGGGRAVLELYADGTHVFASGTFTGKVVVACSRCIGPVELAIDERIRVTFLPPGEIGGGDDEAAGDDGPRIREADPFRAGDRAKPAPIELGAHDVDAFPFDGERVDLEPLLREQFVLAVPFAPLCSDACKGLCAQCGIDLNTGTCACETPVDPRLAALKGLKLPT